MCLLNPITGETYTEPRNDMDKTTVDACKGAIELLEERPKSKWWFSEGEWQCMNCGSELELEDITPFCPYCGADMRGDDE